MENKRKVCKWSLAKNGYGMVRFDLAQPYVSIGFLEEAKKIILDNLAIARRIEQMKKEEQKLDKPSDLMKAELKRLGKI